jgi:hypothetical protein
MMTASILASPAYPHHLAICAVPVAVQYSVFKLPIYGRRLVFQVEVDPAKLDQPELLARSDRTHQIRRMYAFAQLSGMSGVKFDAVRGNQILHSGVLAAEPAAATTEGK